ncbi:MFS transporter [Knoellia sp. S7-12]|uniref:MFS transporter n=1 Tax=Knoellia sp. S7-12 TaxID=3126698 RepID=UPI00336966A9
MTAPDSTEATTHRDPVQRRTVATLSMSQILGGVSLASGVAVGALLAEEVSGSPTYAGLGSTFQVIGSALIAVPMARLSAAHGRRPGLILGYTLSFIGALGLIASGIVGSFALLLVASLLFGGSTASNNQARYAAADLAEPAHRGRDLSLVVWATTIGSVLGPNLVGPSESVSRLLGIPRLTGPFVFSLVGLLLAIAVLAWRLRPDPLVEARRRATEADPGASSRTHGSIGRGLRVIVARPQALLGLITLALGHMTMVSVMVMTPLHMRHGHADLTIIGFVISIHILGMFAFSPLTGMAVDRLGGRIVAMVGSGILAVATLLASTAPMGHSTRLLIALFLLGLGWSCTLVSGSTLLTGALPTAERPGAQGASDLVMGLSAGVGGALAGVVVDRVSFHALALACLVIALAIGAAALVLRGPTDLSD